MPTKAELASRLTAARAEIARLSALKGDIKELQAKNHELGSTVAALIRAKDEKADSNVADLLVSIDAAEKKAAKVARDKDKAIDRLEDEIRVLQSKTRPPNKEQAAELAGARAEIDKLQRELRAT